MTDARTILVAVAWPYANGPRHIGHVAGFGVPSDIYARYQRMAGNNVLMVSGTDEHGTPITVEAAKHDMTPKNFADKNNEIIINDLCQLGLSYDLFTRTTTHNHYDITREMFRTLLENGAITRGTSREPFDVDTNMSLPDRYIEGTCPICKSEGARGDQCDNCGSQLDPQDLIEPVSKVSGKTPGWRDTEHFYLDLPQFSQRLSSWIDSQSAWRPNVKAYSQNFVKDTRKRAITRDLEWGVPIPVPEYENHSAKRIYVWFDAVIGYLSASLEWASISSVKDSWANWWQNPNAEAAYFMGKDNIVFHTVIWPAILMGYGNSGQLTPNNAPLNLPTNIVSSEYLTMEGGKFSTSRGVVIYVRDVLERYGPDPLRYFLCVAGPESSDSDFTWEEFVRRNNEELAANWGNLVSRTLNLAKKYLDNRAPSSDGRIEIDFELIQEIKSGFDRVGSLINEAKFRAGLSEVMRCSAEVNKYLSTHEPWKLAKTDLNRAKVVLGVALEAIANINLMMAPFLPHASNRVALQLGEISQIVPMPIVSKSGGDDSHAVLTTPTDRIAKWEPIELPVGREFGEIEHLFKILGPEVVEEELRRLA